MAELKTKKNDGDVAAFIDSIENDERREDCRAVVELMKDVTGEPPAMWGASLIGFGSYTYTYASGRSGDWMLTGVAPRKQALTVYIMPGLDRYEEHLAKLGKHSTGKSCLYIKKLSDVDENVLRELISDSLDSIEKLYGES